MHSSDNSETYIGADLGTTSVKTGVFDTEGNTLAVTSREFHLDTPAPGFAEFDADNYVASVFDAMREVLSADGIVASSVRAIGLSSQAQTFVAVNAGGRPARPAVSWLDVRAEAEAAELSRVSEAVGAGPVDAIMSAPKLLWLRRHEPEPMNGMSRLLLIPDYLIFRLTGCSITDPVTAASTGLYDARAGRWSGELLDYCGLREAMMPQVSYAGEIAGRLTDEAARELGLERDVIVAVGTNDQSVGALAAGNVTEGCASMTLGTALAIVVTSKSAADIPPGIQPSEHPVQGLYTLLAYAKTAGIVLRWFRDIFSPALSYNDIFNEISTVPIGSEGVSCLPHFSGLASPTFNPSVRGAFSGLSLAHGSAHLARALVESLVFTIRENVELLAPVVGGVKELRAIGGGSRSDVWLQMAADATGVSIVRLATNEAACLGAAELAMVAAGRFGAVDQAALALYWPKRRFEPDQSVRPEYNAAFSRYRALYEALYG